MNEAQIENFDAWEYEDIDHPLCPSCGKEVSDCHNGGDPAPWWDCSHIPNAQFKHECSCGQIFRIESTWSPRFTIVPIEIDDYYSSDEYDGLEEI